MPVIVSHRDVIDQSRQVWNQFGESKWLPYARENAKLKRNDTEELRNIGIGRILVCAAMGESLEEAIPLLKANRHKVDILTCDKGFGALLDHGVLADYVMICDCNILTKWLDPYLGETKKTKLISTPYANVEWTTRWQGPLYFYVNKDAIDSQNHFLKIFGPQIRVIPASTNVSNAMIVFFTGCDESNNVNWGGYDRVLLTGYDYSWRPMESKCPGQPSGKYYAFHDPVPKRFYMAHQHMQDMNNHYVWTSQNLFFSAKWLFSYLTSFKLPVINCSGRGLLLIPARDSLERQLSILSEDMAASRRCRQAFEVTRASNQAFEAAKTMFEKSREDLYQWPSAMKQK